jgi:3-hydroxybutyrate dehydrogenase
LLPLFPSCALQFVRPEDIGALVLHLCGPNSAPFNGACLSMDGGWTAR